jgi:hypothetical protein
VFNAGEWDRIKDTINFTVCDGIVEIYRTTAQPSLMVMDSGDVVIDHKLPTTGKVMQAGTGLRYLVGPLAEPEKWNSEGHSRCVIGKNALGRLLVLSTEGAYPNQGWTLAQCREFMLQHGAVVSADFGGGGDMTVFDRLKGLLLTPENPNGLQRYIPNFFTIKVKENQNMAGTAKSTTHSLSVRPLHQTINSSTIISIPVGTPVPVSETWTAPETTTLNNKGDFWVNVTYGGKSGWVGLIHLGNTYGVYYPPVTPPPAPSGDIALDMTLKADGSIVGTWKNI